MRLLFSVLFLCVAFMGFGQATKLRPLSSVAKSNIGELSDEIAIDSNTTFNGINREGFWVKNVCRKLITASSPTNSVKIKTRVPFSSAASMSNIRIFGGIYALSKNIDIVINYYQYSGGFYSYQWESKGSYAPTEIRLCQEADGYVSVWLGGVNTFYLGLQVDVFRYQDAATKSEMKYWSIVDENYTTATTNVIVPRANLDVQDGTANNHAATIGQLNASVALALRKNAGGTAWDATNLVITNVANGVANSDAMNVGQVRTKISEYNALRGQLNLITNGYGEDNSLYNFNNYGSELLVKDDIKEGTASFYVPNSVNLFTKEFIPYNPSSKYAVKVWAKTKQGYYVYVNILPFDSDGNFINSGNIKSVELTVATAFTASATSITVTTPALTNNPYYWIRNPIYTSQSGRVYNDVGYSQQGARCVNNATASTTISLQSAIGFSKNAGDKIYLCVEGGSYIYPTFAPKTLADTEYELYKATFSSSSDVRLAFTAKIKVGVFGSYQYATPFPNRFSGFSLTEVDGNSLQSVTHSADFTGNGFTTPLALATPYLPLTNTADKTVDMSINTLSVTGSKTSIEKASNSVTNSYTDLSGTITQRQNSARIDSTGFVATVTKGAGASAVQGNFTMSGYPIRPTISYSDQSFKKGWILTAMDTGGKSEWMPERVYGTNRRIATLIGGSSGTTSITLTDEDIIVYTQVSGGQVLVNLPNSTAFCNREIKLVRKGTLLGAQINVASTAAIIQDRNTGNYYSSDVVSGNREYLCDCSGGSPLWLYSSDN